MSVSHGKVTGTVLSTPTAALACLGHSLMSPQGRTLNLMGAGPGLVPRETLLVRMEREVGELLITQKLCWCPGRAVPAPVPTLTIGDADRVLDDIAGIVVHRDGDLVGGHQLTVEGSFDLHSSWEAQKDGCHRLRLWPGLGRAVCASRGLHSALFSCLSKGWMRKTLESYREGQLLCPCCPSPSYPHPRGLWEQLLLLPCTTANT